MAIGNHVCFSNSAAAVTLSTSSKNVIVTSTGSTVVAFCNAFSEDFHATTPMADSGGHTWTQVGSELLAGALRTRIYKASNITGSASHTFTMQMATSGYGSVWVCEVKDLTVSPTVIADRIDDTATPFTSPAITPTGPCVILGQFMSGAAGGTEVDTWGGSFAAGDKIESYGDADNRIVGSMAAAVKGSGGTYTSSVTVSGVTVANSIVSIVSVQTGAGGLAAIAAYYNSRRSNE